MIFKGVQKRFPNIAPKKGGASSPGGVSSSTQMNMTEQSNKKPVSVYFILNVIQWNHSLSN